MKYYYYKIINIHLVKKKLFEHKIRAKVQMTLYESLNENYITLLKFIP